VSIRAALDREHALRSFSIDFTGRGARRCEVVPARRISAGPNQLKAFTRGGMEPC
jgi:hypothetical protein